LEIANAFEEVDVKIDGSKEDVVARVMRETDGIGVNVVMVASPAIIAQVQGVQMAAKRGRVNLFGGLPKGKSEATFDSNIIHYRELFVHGTSDSTITHMQDILSLVTSGRFKPSRFISKFIPLSNFKEAFEMAAGGKELKVVLQPGK
jgi:L-iditol 2-dehydrogenase